MANVTEVVFILDKSGSMHGLEADTIGGFNSMLKKQKESDEKTYITTILFSDSSELIHDRTDLLEVKDMTEKDYYPGGCTALLDTVGETIERIKLIHKYVREEDRPDKTLFVIITDGEENASRKYSYAQIKALINEQQKKHEWEFIYLGANIDAAASADTIGISKNKAFQYKSDKKGTACSYSAVGNALCAFRSMNIEDMADFEMELPRYMSAVTEDVKKRGR